MDVCKICGAKAEATTEKVWQSYVMFDMDGITGYKPNPELDEETIEVYFWCLKCLRKSESWD